MTVTLTASIVLGQNGYTTADISAVNTEYIIDEATDYINFIAKTSIADMSGTAGSKSVTVTGNENAVLSTLLTCMLRDAKKTSLSNSTSTSSSNGSARSVAVGNISTSESGSTSASISAATSLNGADDFTRYLFMEGIKRLTGHYFQRIR